MERPKKILLIGCAAVINEIHQLVDGRLPTCLTVDAGLHLHPEKLKISLQQTIDAHDGKFDPIVLGFGLCANAVVGLTAHRSTLVVPRADDCIAMFLGSQERYKIELAKAPGTYFLSKGYIDAGISLMDEFKQMVARFGQARARQLQKKMFAHYTRLAYIASGHGDQDHYRRVSRQAAADLELEFEEIAGTDRMLKSIVDCRWDHNFIIVTPGRAITFADFRATIPPLKAE